MEERKGRVLCLDSDKYTCELVTVSLRPKGYEVIAVETIREALKLLEKGGFDLVIVNEKLPDGQGLDFCRRMSESGSPIPVVLHATPLCKADMDLAIQAGAHDYLIKPNGWRKLTETVDRLLRKSHAAGQ
jgi:DNA-binding response OmpR family regulator